VHCQTASTRGACGKDLCTGGASFVLGLASRAQYDLGEGMASFWDWPARPMAVGQASSISGATSGWTIRRLAREDPDDLR
jgi:hypothetical protein